MASPDIHRWELVEFIVHPPLDQLVIEEVLDRLRAELGDRWRHSRAVEITVGNEGEIVFRYRKPRTDPAWAPLGYVQDDTIDQQGE